MEVYIILCGQYESEHITNVVYDMQEAAEIICKLRKEEYSDSFSELQVWKNNERLFSYGEDDEHMSEKETLDDIKKRFIRCAKSTE